MANKDTRLKKIYYEGYIDGCIDMRNRINKEKQNIYNKGYLDGYKKAIKDIKKVIKQL